MAKAYNRRIRVFLCHASNDKRKARELHKRFQEQGVDSWLDEEKLIPGQNWEEEIPKAILTSDVVVVCLSNNSINKDGYVQKEIRIALDAANQKPDGTIYIIPVRFEECPLPSKIRNIQWVNYFEDGGYRRLVTSLRVRALKLKEQGNNIRLPKEVKVAQYELEGGHSGIPKSISVSSKIPETETTTDKEDANRYAKIFNLPAKKKRHINEARLIVVGQGSVGKTSIIRQIMYSAFDRGQTKTDGISINQWRVERRKKRETKGQSEIENQKPEIKLNIWDFGGQEIMHATHQFFLTKRCLYLLVLDSRLTQEENRVQYWLEIIQSFGGESPVLIVGNKTDQHPLDIDRTGLHKKYPNIVGILETSAATGAGIAALKAEIAKQVDTLPHVRNLVPETWLVIKSKLEELGRDKNFITQDEYLSLCETNNVTDETSQHMLIGFLHDLGVVLHFQDDPRLEALVILNPEWVTIGIYKILNSHEVFHNQGKLTLSILNMALNLPEYPRDKRLFIVDMMKKFELCYDLEPDKSFLIPDLLPKDEPFTGEWDGALAYQYHYNVLPSSIITRFIVRMNTFVHKTVWRLGVVLRNQSNLALIKSDYEERSILIFVSGVDSTRRDFLAMIRQEFESIHKTISGIKVIPEIQHPNHPELILDYEELLEFERQGVSEFPRRVNGQIIKVNVKELLNGIESQKSI